MFAKKLLPVFPPIEYRVCRSLSHVLSRRYYCPDRGGAVVRARASDIVVGGLSSNPATDT